jgi:AraC-like DNA-binding protein
VTQRARQNTASVAYLKALFDYAQAHVLSQEKLISGHSIDFSDKDARLPESECAALFDKAAEWLKDDALGLHVGESIRPGHYGALGYVAMNCATVGEALARLNRYQALVLDIGAPEMQAGKHDIRLAWDPDTERPFRQLAEFNLSGLVTFVRWITGRAGSPRRIEFNYPAPEHIDEHRRIFGCELVFNQPRYAIVFPLDWLQLPLIQPDPEMRALMLRLADKQMLSLERGADPMAKARSLIAQNLSNGEMELGALAGRLEMSARTLQRKLKDAGVSYTELVDGVRKEMALRYLADETFDLNDLAFLLGFSEQSAFQRAFKRWTGETPGAWRSRHSRG